MAEKEIPIEIKKISIKGKSIPDAITPLHLAAINPNVNVLKQILDSIEENADLVQELFESGDSIGGIPTHYAAACLNPENLEYMMDICSASATWGDTKEEHAFTIASFLGRLGQLEILCGGQGKMVNEPATNSKMTALGYAAGYGWTECVFYLLNNGAKVNN